MTVVRLRKTWDATWMACADVMAQRSICERDQVGAVIVDATNRIVATGYNGPPAGMDAVCEACPRRIFGSPQRCISVHAEANAIAFCDRSLREGGTIYVTSVICNDCALLVANSGLGRVVVRWNVEGKEHRDPNYSVRVLEMSGLEVVRWLS